MPISSQAHHDYERIAQVLHFLQKNFLDQPDLDTLARRVHLSPFHFQRLFTRWAGVSPKRFLGYLTLDYAKQQLATSRDILSVAYESGLSSPGRLHDLFVSYEAMTPGEFKTRGANLLIRYGFHPTPFGTALVATTERGLCALTFLRKKEKPIDALAELKAHWSGARFQLDPIATRAILHRIFKTDSKDPLQLLLKGTPFQIKVWEALLRLPPGTVTTYGEIANRLGASGSSRAVGAAVGRNPIAYLIPCHRVIQKSGLLGGYRWGSARKQAILGWEAAQKARPDPDSP